MERKVVITGIGVLSPIGTGREDYWEALLRGKTGFSTITLFDTSSFDVHVAGELRDFDPEIFLGKKGLRELDRSARLVCSAAKLAIDDARLGITDENTGSIGVSIGTTFGSLHSISQFDRQGLLEGPRYVNPSHFPNTVLNSPASRVSIRFNIKGFNTTISTGFCASLDALSYATDFIRLQRATAVLAGGVEELCEETFLGFYKLGCLSGIDSSEPISCPFDKRRDGVILSEGAAVLMLEDEEHAINRGAEILSEVKGYGNSFDPSGWDGQGDGLKRAINMALEEVSIREIDYICSCANSTEKLDRMEARALKDIFGSRAYDIPMSSIKSMIGETFSASGALSLTAAVGAIKLGFIPPTMNHHERDPECDLNFVKNESIQKQVNTALITASDHYGQNTAMVIGRYREKG